jgi:short-subunit dehydrogenase
MDLTSPDSFHHLFSSLQDDSVSRVSILINNAGHLVNKPMCEQTQDEITSSYMVNVIGPHLLIGKLRPFLVNGGHIVNIGSMGGMTVTSKFPGLSSYSPSKAALAVLSELLAEEFLGDQISVNCLALGTVNTEMLKAAFPGFEGQQSPESMARLVKTFALEGHKWFNGKVLPVSLVGK